MSNYSDVPVKCCNALGEAFVGLIVHRVAAGLPELGALELAGEQDGRVSLAQAGELSEADAAERKL